MSRLTEDDVVYIIREGFVADHTPITAEGFFLLLEDQGDKVPIYRLKRNLFMLVHLGELKYDVVSKEFYADADYDPPDAPSR